ncbi:uncharacterized protein LOC141769772 [Sebastes fasciatus]|uniref:uncharacterized protein LOC141769772 n=1 Tax=Sebastes fasciatus TaxID=394691 RepID=UPI003D9E2785
MSSVEYLREFVNERLTAAAEEIFRVFKNIILESEEEIDRQRKLLDVVWNPDRIELPQQHVCKEEEVLADQQLCIQERNSSLDQEDPEPPQIKEEQEELCTSQEGEQLVLKQAFMLTPTYEENNNSDHQLLSQNYHVAKSQDRKGGKHGDSGSTRNKEPKLKAQSISHNESTLQRHLSVHTDEKLCLCKTCGKRFCAQAALKRHMTIHTGEKPHTCETCGKDFRLGSVLKVHMRTHTGEKPWLCKTCGKRFSDISVLKRHMTIHTGEKPHTCEICGKDFRLSSALKLHMRTHTGEKPYLCKTCEKRFSDNKALKRHKRIHTGETTHTCEICGKAFRRGNALKVHMRIHTGEKPYLCKTCGESFGYMSALKNHIIIHTG